MKKRLLAIVMTLAMCCAPVSAFAEGGATVDDVLAMTQEFQKSITSTCIDMTLTLDAELTIASDGAEPIVLPLGVTGNFDVDALSKAMQTSMKGTYNMNIAGSPMQATMEMYTVESDDGMKMDTFSKMDMGTGVEPQWVHQQVNVSSLLEALGVSSLDELQNLDTTRAYDKLNLEWTMEESDDAYTLSSTFGFADIEDLITASVEESGQEIPQDALDMVTSVLSGLMANISMTVDKETGAETSIHMDMNGSDLSPLLDALTSVLQNFLGEGAAMPELSLTLNELSVDGIVSYDTVTEITIPAEALATEPTDMTSAVSSMMPQASDLNVNP